MEPDKKTPVLITITGIWLYVAGILMTLFGLFCFVVGCMINGKDISGIIIFFSPIAIPGLLCIAAGKWVFEKEYWWVVFLISVFSCAIFGITLIPVILLIISKNEFY
jgi:hypothetical protein